ncbi:MAG: filamentous hemagglutinin N-terminal domain-containing protein, partial [Burkholderiaceae bacterium]
MNHVYRLKRSGRSQQLQPVPETVRASGKGSRTSKALAQTVGAALASVALGGMASLAHAQQAPPAVNQLPQGGVVTRGSANINTSTTPAGTALMAVNQGSARAVIDWASFNVGSQAKVQFNQPSSSAVVLNNILGNNASQIYGQISANGQVFLSNPNGVYFSPTAQVNVGGLVATTGKAKADEFMAGKASFSREGSTGSVVNEGQLKAAAGGYIALLAPEVRNQGVIIAQAGTAALASGEAITLSFNNAGTGLAGLTTTPQAIAALVENRSAVLAEGGQIILSAHALATLQGSVIKNSGQLSATSLTEKGGKIVLMGDRIELTGTSKIEANGARGGGAVLVGGDWQGSGDVRQAVQVTMAQGASIEANATQQGDGGKVVLWSDVHNASSQTTVAGSISAEGRGANTTGGQIETSGARLSVADSASIRMGGEGATGGRWLLDPNDFTIAASGGDITGTALAASISAGNTVEVLSSSGASGTAGNINVNDAVSWNNTGVLKLTAAGGVTGASAISMSGAAGTGLVLNQAGTSTYSGTIIAGANATVTKQGSGTLTLSGANTHGSTVISQGTLKLGSTTALGTGTAGTVTLSAGATLDLNGQTILSANAKALNISGSGVNGAGALINSSATAATYPGLLTLGAGTAINATSGGIVLSNTGTITGAGFNLTLGGAATGSSIAGIIGTGTGSVTKQDAGTWTLTGSNTYTGGTNFNGGNLVAGSNGALGSSGTLSFAGGTLVYGGSTTDYSARFSTAANQVYAIETGPATITWATSLTAAGSSLIKSGGSILRLDAANGLSGGITVRQGTLFLGNSSGLGTGPVVVNTGAAIDLNGKTVTSANPLSLSGTGPSGLGALLNASASAPASFNGLISLAGHTTINATQQQSLNLSHTGAITGSGYDLTISGAWSNCIITLAGSLNTGGGRLIKTGNS